MLLGLSIEWVIAGTEYLEVSLVAKGTVPLTFRVPLLQHPPRHEAPHQVTGTCHADAKAPRHERDIDDWVTLQQVQEFEGIATPASA